MNRIGKYEILEELGRGGMGVVYKAYDSVMEREVALKVILDIALGAPEIKARFYREARTAGKLTHENITIVHDVGEDEGRPYIVMEYLPGYDLRQLLDQKQPLSLQLKLDIAIQAARGLAFSHSRDIIHRDIKPANIRIVDDRKVKLMDFGIAKPGSSSLTSTGTLIGTPYYMSPEQVQGKKVDRRSDIFSFGVLLYELVTGLKPFTGEEPTSVMYKIVHEEPEHLSDLQKATPPGVQAVIARLLRKNPDDRYQSLDDAANDLEHVLHDMRREGVRETSDRRKKFEKFVTDARAFAGKKKFRDAYQAADKAAALDPESSQLLRLRDEIKRAEDEELKRAFVRDRLPSARKLVNARQFENAFPVLKEMVEADPRHTEAQQLLKQASDGLAARLIGDAQLAVKRGDGSAAEQLVRRVLSFQPDNARARDLVRILEARGSGEETSVGGLDAPPAATVVSTTPIPSDRTRAPVAEELPQPPAPPAPRPMRAPAKMPVSRNALAAIAGGVVVVLLTVYFLFLSGPSVPTGYVALNIIPWAEITKVDRTGAGPFPMEGKLVTPCRLELPEGSYTITLSNPSLKTPLQVTVAVKAGEVQEVRRKLQGFDYQSILSTF